MSRRSLVHVAKARSERRLNHCTGIVDLTHTCETMRHEAQTRYTRLPRSVNCSDAVPSMACLATGLEYQSHKCDSSERMRDCEYVLACTMPCATQHKQGLPTDPIARAGRSCSSARSEPIGHIASIYRPSAGDIQGMSSLPIDALNVI